MDGRAPPCFCSISGAIEGTRTPTPLPVHGPEPCASANSATMAILDCNAAAAPRPLSGRSTFLFYSPVSACQTTGSRQCPNELPQSFPMKLCVLSVKGLPEPWNLTPASPSSKSSHSAPLTPDNPSPPLLHTSGMSARLLPEPYPPHRCGSM
jgi:hypothetical protein